MSAEHDVDLELKQFLQKNGGKAVTFKALHAAMEDNIDGFMKVLKAAFGSHKAARVVLEQRIAQLEARPAMRFAGVHSADSEYQPGDCVTRSGSLWTCTRKTSGTFAHSDWQLCVKRGDAS